MSKILIVGTVPKVSGIGGVTIHVERLLKYLAKSHISFDFCDYKQSSLRTVLGEVVRHDVIHIHPSNPYFRLFLILFCKLFRKKVIFTVHGNLGRYSALKNFLDKCSVRYSDIPIVINKGSFIKAIKLNKSSVLLSAFIPPECEDNLPVELSKEIQCVRDGGKIIVVTNASARSFTSFGEEIYGIDFLVDYFKDKEDYFLIVSDPSSQYTLKYSNEKFANILLVDIPHSFYALMKRADIMIRATVTDGDSLSVREGLFAGIKVIATNCVDRPDGICLFKYNDAESLSHAIQTEKIVKHQQEDNPVAKILELYKIFDL